jgi:hypothetical protein
VKVGAGAPKINVEGLTLESAVSSSGGVDVGGEASAEPNTYVNGGGETTDASLSTGEEAEARLLGGRRQTLDGKTYKCFLDSCETLSSSPIFDLDAVSQIVELACGTRRGPLSDELWKAKSDV